MVEVLTPKTVDNSSTEAYCWVSKISKTLRDEYPIVTDSSGQIIWIPGIKKSHLDRKKEEKYDIILKYD